jgi:hypothetical protein
MTTMHPLATHHTTSILILFYYSNTKHCTKITLQYVKITVRHCICSAACSVAGNMMELGHGPVQVNSCFLHLAKIAGSELVHLLVLFIILIRRVLVVGCEPCCHHLSILLLNSIPSYDNTMAAIKLLRITVALSLTYVTILAA